MTEKYNVGAHGSVTHGRHDPRCTRVEGTLDHPALVRGDPDDRADPSVGDGVAELHMREQQYQP